MVLQMKMLFQIEHSSTTLLDVGEPRNNSKNHYINLCLRVDI